MEAEASVELFGTDLKVLTDRHLPHSADSVKLLLCSVIERLIYASLAGVLYNQFLSQADFEVLRDRAQVGLCFLSLYMTNILL